MNKKQKKNLIRIIISSILYIALFISSRLFSMNEILKLILFLVPYLIIGYDILLKAMKGIKNLKPFDENFLMAVATIGAIALGEYTEGVAVMLFYQIGELFQSVASSKSRKNIASLMDLRPDYANIYNEEGEIEKVDPKNINLDDTIVVLPGEKIPLDGVVVEGETTLNTSSLTGESMPRFVKQDDDVLSGCINLDSIIKVKVTKTFTESTASKILELIQNASSKKSKQENFISKFARVYTPIVCYSALFLAVVMPLIIYLFDNNNLDFATWIYRALTFLVISCPCALVISIPLSFFGGLGGASHAGILIKGSNYLEALSRTKIVVFDKTGTMTKGVFEVSDIHHPLVDKKMLLYCAAHAEMFSTHPIGKSLVKAYEKENNKKCEEHRVKDLIEISGHGIECMVDDKKVLIGNQKLMKDKNIEYIECHDEGTIIHIALDNNYAGHFVINDVVKEDSHEAILKLKKIGIRKTIMLTGDIDSVAKNIAKELEIDEVYSEQLPNDKVKKLDEILKEKNDKKESDIVCFVGDGINDAPVLSRADIGIAMGGLGSDAAIEASDVVLMDDNPLKIARAIKISKKCIRIVYENIYFAIGIKFICLVLGALGLCNMWFAIFADVGVMIIAVLNSIRSLNTKNL
ncbi:MAG: cadmium-translocating P-type ATPase [Clostridia bacterium]|nr:cadmium-translocating P-type ATPase [Clostridia bacterium]